MKKTNNWIFLILLLIGFGQLACSNDDELSEIIPCHKTVIEGTWNVASEYTQYYEVQDSSVISTNFSTTSFFEDGTGTQEVENVNIVGKFTWTIQCNPDRLLINDLGGFSFEESGQDPMDYVAFTAYYTVNSIRNDEITLSAEFYQGNNETRRKVNLNSVCTRIE